MKKKMRNVYVAISALMLALMTSGCNGVSSFGYNPFPNISIKEEVHLTEDKDSPFCDFTIDYSYVNEKGDSIASIINRETQRELLGEDYANLSPEVALDSFKNVYIRDYREVTEGFYRVDGGRNDYSLPKWYERTYTLMTFAEEGREGIINISANYFEDMAGPHPNQHGRWLNFDANTGKLLTQEDVFLEEAKTEIEQMLIQKILVQQAELYPKENIETLEDLREKGILEYTNIYIPDNFLLAKDKVSFLFNRYDIAPYSVGETVIDMTYEEIGHCLKGEISSNPIIK